MHGLRPSGDAELDLRVPHHHGHRRIRYSQALRNLRRRIVVGIQTQHLTLPLRAKEGYTYGQHHPKVRFDDSILYCGTAAYTYMALRWLAEHQ